MRDESLFVKDFHGQTTIHELGLSLLIVLGVAMLFLKRRSAIIPILIMACFVAPGQRIVVFSLDFNLIRVLILIGLVRVVFFGEAKFFSWCLLDKTVLAWGLSGLVAYVALRGSTGAFIYKMGSLFDSMGAYFLFRCLVRDIDDLKHLLTALVYLSIPVSIFLFFEKLTGRNVFSVFGGVPEYTAIRYEKLRAQGAFAHPIIAGCFWVTQLPLFIALWWQGVKPWLVLSGCTASLVIVIACASSTPIAGVGAVIVGFSFFTFRRHLPAFRWCVLSVLVLLHFVMEAPVWHLISRIDLVGGSTGWHRSYLIEQTIYRFKEWWLFGTLSTGHWGWDMFDTANMYVNEAVRGGFATLVLFIAILVLAFQGVGRLLVKYEGDNKNTIFMWAMGVALFAHCTVFIAVSYFGQIFVVWYLLLASIGSLTSTNDKHLKCQ
ncbi:hypothetical protein P9J64_00725 [Deltaproteobacteria bacterium IMCC39524]|nr:hypothetical protein [Deltaproteobacteria bacterium IMCC39524]